LIDCSSCNHSIDLGVTQQQQRRLCSIKCSQHQELFMSLEHNGTSTEVHLVASRMSQCSLQLSEFQFDNAPARPTTYTTPLAGHRTDPRSTSQTICGKGVR